MNSKRVRILLDNKSEINFINNIFTRKSEVIIFKLK